METGGERIECVDLTTTPGHGPLHTRAFYALRDLEPGRALDLVVDEEPGLLMEAVNFQLRRRLHWEVRQSRAGRWVVRVRHRDDTPAAGVMDLMARDHERLDRLLARLLAELNGGRSGPLAEEFERALRRHIYVENEILAPHFGRPAQPASHDPVAVMFDDHERILRELELVRAALAGSDADPLVAASYAAMLSGSMAKHEGREERELFPRWEEAYRRAPAPGMLRRIEAVLSGEEDSRLPGDV